MIGRIKTKKDMTGTHRGLFASMKQGEMGDHTIKHGLFESMLTGSIKTVKNSPKKLNERMKQG